MGRGTKFVPKKPVIKISHIFKNLNAKKIHAEQIIKSLNKVRLLLFYDPALLRSGKGCFQPA